MPLSEIIVNTGNILNSEHLKKRVNLGPQEELVDSLREALKSSAAELKKGAADKPDSRWACGDTTSDLFAEESREELKITVKIFLMDVTKESLISAVNETLRQLQVNTLDLLLLSVPSNNYDQFKEVWAALEGYAKSGALESIGVSDFDLAEFDKLYEAASVKPSVNQVNLESCCVIPPELSDFAKKNNVQLLTHNDPRTMLEPESVADILKSADLACLEPETCTVAWLVRYSAMVKLRGVVKSRGFIFSIHQKK
ncbi:putative Glutamate--cysteine ligase regulatory subunit [Hypsibius exemplaris]|uniref:GCS light chain n=1 Tax=Hypsibius exemplaris TaxID=2072580 RepID=A0A1W0WCJ1_HYPEX|nr:putative Glutamate--cysteine ligase regulatory subunit [Hypsibius exemplaris]